MREPTLSEVEEIYNNRRFIYYNDLKCIITGYKWFEFDELSVYVDLYRVEDTPINTPHPLSDLRIIREVDIRDLRIPCEDQDSQYIGAPGGPEKEEI